MSYDIGLKLGIDGEAEFRKKIGEVAAQTQVLATEMGLVTAQFAKNATSQQALTSKTAVLNKQIDAQREKLEAQQQMLARSTELYGAADSRTQSWQKIVNKSTEQLYKMENALKDMGEELDDSSKKALDFGDILKANVMGDLIVEGLKETARLIRELGGASIKAAAEVQASNAQFEQTFAELGGEAQAAIDRVADRSGILGTRLQGAATQMYAFAKSAGGDSVQSMDLMERAMVVAADSAAYYDRSLEDTLESLRSFMKGNYANDAALGLSATEATRNAAAMDLFGQKYKDLTEIQKQETLLHMVENSMALSGAMGQAAREASGWANVQGNLNEALRLAKADIGAGILPAVTELSQALTGALTGDLSAGEFSKVAAEIVATLASDFANEAPTLIKTGVEMIVAFLDGLLKEDSLDKIADGAAEVIVALVKGFVDLLPEIVVFSIQLLRTLSKALYEHLPELTSAIPDLIFGLVTALLEGLPDIFQAGANLIAGLYNGFASGIESFLDNIRNFGFRAIEHLKAVFGIHSPSTVFMSIGEYLMEGLAIGMENSKGKAMETAEDIAKELSERVRTLTGAFSQAADIADLQYQLWELTGGKNATDLEKYNAKLETLNRQEAAQAGVVETAQEAYDAMADQYGENSTQAMEYLEILLKERIAYEKLSASIQDVLDKQAELAAVDSISASYADVAETMFYAAGTKNRVNSSLKAETSSSADTMANRGNFSATITLATEDGRNLGRFVTPFVNEENKSNPEVVSDRL